MKERARRREREREREIKNKSAEMPDWLNSILNVFLYNMCSWKLGSSDSTWKQGEWVFQPKADSDQTVQIKHHDDMDSTNPNEFHTDAGTNKKTSNSIPDAISQCWPKDWLPIDFPNARICAMNYDTGEQQANFNCMSIDTSTIYG